MTGVKICDEDVEECAYLMIRPDPCCPECIAIMVWRSVHRGIVITDAAEIKLTDYGWGNRHLHVRDLRVARRKNRVVRGTQGTGEERTSPPGGVAGSCSPPSPSLLSSGRPPIGD